MKEKRSLYLKILATYLMALACVLLLIFVFPKLISFFWPLVVGWIIAMIANPMVRFLESKLKIVRKHGSVIVIVFTLAVVIGILYLLFYILIKQGISFAKDVPNMYADLSKSLQETAVEYKDKYTFLPAEMRDWLDNIVGNVGMFLDSIIHDIIENSNFSLSGSVSVVKSIAEGLLMTIFTILFSYFLTAEHDKISTFYNKRLPSSLREGLNVVKESITTAFGGYFKAQFKIMACLFVILSIGLLCLRINYAILIALIIAFVDFLPVLGAGAVMWPWCVYDIVMGDYVEAIILFVLYLLCQGVRHFLQPKMVADSIGMNPLLTLIFMFIGYRLDGILGLIIGIPVGMIIVSFYRKGVFDRLIRGAKIIASDFGNWRKY